MTHRNLDLSHRVEEEDDFIFAQDDSEDEDFPIDDSDWEDEFWDEEDSVNG